MFEFSVDKTYALFQNPLNKKTIEEIEKTGADLILLPSVKTSAIYPLKENLTNFISIFDWLIFTDIYTVEYFLEKLREEGFDFFELDNFRVCAYGETVADFLRYSQLHADVVPANLKIETIVQDLSNYLFDESELVNLRFLVLCEKSVNPEIILKLKEFGARADLLPVYEIITEDSPELTKLKTLLRGGAADEFLFTSPQDVLNLAHYFQNENLNDVLDETKISFTDQITRQSLEEFRLI